MVSAVSAIFGSTFFFLHLCACVFGQIPQGSKKYFASSFDIPFIRCSVCQRALKHIKHEVSLSRDEASAKGKKVDEDEILSIVEASCNPDKKQGEWISRYDIEEQPSGLKLVENKSPSRCKQECKTISKACEESIGDIDTDLGEFLWQDQLSLSQLINKVCYEMTGICTQKLPKFKPGKREDEIFVPMTEDEKKAYDMMKQMKSMPGMPGMDMYSKEDIAKMQEQMKSPPNEEDAQNANKDEATHQQTNLGFFDTMKATFSYLYKRIKNIFSFRNRKTEL
ncbi:uncharacterized protein LOC135692002 [Rhopilema esculentum]|uniref:uncharacterized protein LOC135692002 n=1 Tax=Rhopilema esculentum TaxID=499914 RepID=UPI0031DD46BB